jgi:hypothetical protein
MARYSTSAFSYLHHRHLPHLVRPQPRRRRGAAGGVADELRVHPDRAWSAGRGARPATTTPAAATVTCRRYPARLARGSGLRPVPVAAVVRLPAAGGAAAGLGAQTAEQHPGCRVLRLVMQQPGAWRRRRPCWRWCSACSWPTASAASDPGVAAAVRVAGMGYAVPGTVIAVGVLIPFAWIDNTHRWLDAPDSFDISTGLILSGTLVALLFAYTRAFWPCHCRPWRRVSARSGPAWTMRRVPWACRPTRYFAHPHAHHARQPAHRRPAGLRGCAQGTAGHPDPAALQLQHPRGARLRAGLR